MPVKKPKTYACFCRSDNPAAADLSLKVKTWLGKNYPKVKEDLRQPDLLLVLGGDGTVLEAARKYNKHEPTMLSVNLGNVGFLSSVRKEKDFFRALKKFFKGDYLSENRMLLSVEVKRRGKRIFKTESLNEVIVQNLLGMVELEASVAGHPLQYIRGTGALVSTPTGSTAYNLSAHGPMVMPNLECLILTELLDHNLPTPSLIVPKDKVISLKIMNFRKHGLLSVTKTKKPIDVLLSADSASLCPLEAGDIVSVRGAKRYVKFAVFDKNHFLKSIQDKFSFR